MRNISEFADNHIIENECILKSGTDTYKCSNSESVIIVDEPWINSGEPLNCKIVFKEGVSEIESNPFNNMELAQKYLDNAEKYSRKINMILNEIPSKSRSERRYKESFKVTTSKFEDYCPNSDKGFSMPNANYKQESNQRIKQDWKTTNIGLINKILK
jgi:hypothetical protein